MNIGIRLEGGLGDHLLGNRFLHAIKDKYPNSNLYIYSDTENNSNSLNILRSLYPSIYKYDTSEVIKFRKDKNYKIHTKFGEETYPADISNLPDEITEKIKTYDRFYDLHIDGLKWLNYDFDWFRYYYFFPKPEININKKYNEKYIMAHFYSRPDSPYNLDQTYIIDLLTELSKYIKIVVLTLEEHKDYYKNLFNNQNIIIDTASNLLEVFQIASGCELFIGIDSGIRYIPYHFSKPTFVFSKYCSKYGSVAPSHLIRWLIFEKNVFPINFNIEIVTAIISNILNNPASQLFPEYVNGIDSAIVNRFL